MEKFTFGSSGSAVGLSKPAVRKMKETLGFYSQREYFLRLPDKNYLYMILFCLIAKSNKLTKNLSKLLNSLDKGYIKTITQQHLEPNFKREQFNAPLELQKVSNTLHYHVKMFEGCHLKFDEKSIQYPSTCLKKEEKLIFRYFGNRDTEFGENARFDDSVQAILLIEEDNGKSLIIAAFKGRKLGKEEIVTQAQQEEKVLERPLDEQGQQEPPMPDDAAEDNEDQLQSQEDKKENLIFGVFLAIILICLLALLDRNSPASTSLDRLLIQYFPNSTFFINCWDSISPF